MDVKNFFDVSWTDFYESETDFDGFRFLTCFSHPPLPGVEDPPPISLLSWVLIQINHLFKIFFIIMKNWIRIFVGTSSPWLSSVEYMYEKESDTYGYKFWLVWSNGHIIGFIYLAKFGWLPLLLLRLHSSLSVTLGKRSASVSQVIIIINIVIIIFIITITFITCSKWSDQFQRKSTSVTRHPLNSRTWSCW